MITITKDDKIITVNEKEAEKALKYDWKSTIFKANTVIATIENNEKMLILETTGESSITYNNPEDKSITKTFQGELAEDFLIILTDIEKTRQDNIKESGEFEESFIEDKFIINNHNWFSITTFKKKKQNLIVEDSYPVDPEIKDIDELIDYMFDLLD